MCIGIQGRDRIQEEILCENSTECSQLTADVCGKVNNHKFVFLFPCSHPFPNWKLDVFDLYFSAKELETIRNQ